MQLCMHSALKHTHTHQIKHTHPVAWNSQFLPLRKLHWCKNQQRMCGCLCVSELVDKQTNFVCIRIVSVCNLWRTRQIDFPVKTAPVYRVREKNRWTERRESERESQTEGVSRQQNCYLDTQPLCALLLFMLWCDWIRIKLTMCQQTKGWWTCWVTDSVCHWHCNSAL